MLKVTMFCVCAFLLVCFTHGVDALTDDFNDGNDKDWKQIQGKWSVKNGWYIQEDTVWTTTATNETYTRNYFGEEDWTDYVLEAKVRIEKGGELAPIIGIFFRVTEKSPAGNYYYFRLDARAADGPCLIKAPNIIIIENTSKPCKIGQDYILKVDVKGDIIKCYIDGQLEIEAQDNAFQQGAIGVGTFNAEGYFDNVTVNGKGIPSAVSSKEKLAITWASVK